MTPLSYPTGERVVIRSENHNLARWVASGEPHCWVESHAAGWDHNDWLSLIAALRASTYWPMEPVAVGQVLEKLKHNCHLKRNSDLAFVGIQTLKDKQRWQLGKFQQAAACGNWMAIHQDHYDWWMFPIDEPSMYGLAWTVYEGDIANLKDDYEYLDCYLLGVELLAKSWGWDLRQGRYFSDLQPGQCWQNWPIRLYKAAKSVRLFGFEAEFGFLKKLGQDLIHKGEKMYYHRDLSWLFRDCFEENGDILE